MYNYNISIADLLARIPRILVFVFRSYYVIRVIYRDNNYCAFPLLYCWAD